jgi:hypothetical protein
MPTDRHKRAADLTRRLPKRAVADAFGSLHPDTFQLVSLALEEAAIDEVDRILDANRAHEEERQRNVRQLRRGPA